MPPTSSEPAGPGPRLRLRLTAVAESIIRRGHPWIYSDSVREENRPGVTGELAAIYDRKDRLLALGWYDAASPIRVRILHRGGPAKLDEAWWRARLRAAVDLRRPWFGPDTDGYRLVHGENDGFPGLVLDRYGDTLVAKIYFAAWLPRWPAMAALILSELKPGRLVLRLSRNLAEQAGSAGLTDGTVASGDPTTPTSLFHENGLRFQSDVLAGQKTGFFLDQRENRKRVETLSSGCEVLNLFSFSGGFSLYAARGGATAVTDVDLSEHALEAARRNFELNQGISAVASAGHERVQANAFAWLEAPLQWRYDLVILDPPSLARCEADRGGAVEAYERLAGGAVARVRPGGRFVAASCSAHVSEEEFFDAVRRSLRRAGRSYSVEAATEEPPDHPATFPEARYLKTIYLKLKD